MPIQKKAATHYYVAVPLADLDTALQAQPACMRGIDDSQEEWSEERGAIEQEVAQSHCCRHSTRATCSWRP
jgi:zinc protease